MSFPRRKQRGTGAPVRARGSGRPVTRSVVQFAVTGLAAVALLGFVGVQILERTGRREAIRDAKHETELAGRGIVAPQITRGLFTGRPEAIAALDRVVRPRALRDPVVRVKLWDGSGRILYSDEHRLIGTRYLLRPDELRALRSGGVDAEVSDLSKPENRFERPQTKLLEVYLGVRAPNGRRLLYEDYLKYSSIAASGHRLWLSFAPALIVTLVALELAQVPLAWSLARRLQRGQEERLALLQRALEASDTERRRVARDLHDGVVQRLAGVSYSLAAAAQRIESDPQTAAKMVDRAAGETRHGVRDLRTLIVDVYPPALTRAGLRAALADLVAPLRARGVEVDLDLPPDLDLSADKERLLYRAAQEAVRNVVRHADAHHVRVHAARDNGRAVVAVEDDGVGFVLAGDGAGEGHRHFGLRILRDLARDTGGELTIDSAPGAGTRIRLEVPA